MSIPPIAALEIGTTRTVALVGEVGPEDRMTVIGRGVGLSTGVHKGQVVDFSHAESGVSQAVKQATEESRVDIGRVLLAASGGYISAEINQGTSPVYSRDHIVTSEDVDEVIQNARSISLPPSQSIMHTIPRRYRLDGQTGIVKPEGLKGFNLSLDMLVVHAQTGPVENLRNVAQAASLDVEDVAFSALCSALAVLSPEQKNAGVAVVDLGGGTTNFVAYVDGVPASAGAISVGGDHVTNDIVQAFNLVTQRAEDIKIEFGNALVGGGTERIPLPGDFGIRDRTISLKALRTVINARMDETLKIVRAKLVRDGVLSRLGAGVVFTGGGASMPGLTTLGQTVFGVPCMIGVPRNVFGLEGVRDPHSYAVAAGLLIYGFNSMKSRKNSSFDSIRRFFGI